MPDDETQHPLSSAQAVIRQVSTSEEYECARLLFQEYASAIEVDLCFQGFSDELTVLNQMYAPPDGCLCVAYVGAKPAGCAALRKFDADVGELKRMYVRPEFRGCGIGKALATTILRTAQNIGYSIVRLDTLESMSEARRIYELLGFHPCPAYYTNPLPGVIYMEKELTGGAE